jgi:hypothetical protein
VQLELMTSLARKRIRYGSLKSCSVPLIEKMIVSRIAGHSSGSWISRANCQDDAPSICEASARSDGIHDRFGPRTGHCPLAAPRQQRTCYIKSAEECL